MEKNATEYLCKSYLYEAKTRDRELELELENFILQGL